MMEMCLKALFEFIVGNNYYLKCPDKRGILMVKFIAKLVSTWSKSSVLISGLKQTLFACFKPLMSTELFLQVETSLVINFTINVPLLSGHFR